MELGGLESVLSREKKSGLHLSIKRQDIDIRYNLPYLICFLEDHYKAKELSLPSEVLDIYRPSSVYGDQEDLSKG